MRLSCTVMEIWRLKYWTHGPGHRKKDGRMERKRGRGRGRKGKKKMENKKEEEGERIALDRQQVRHVTVRLPSHTKQQTAVC